MYYAWAGGVTVLTGGEASPYTIPSILAVGMVGGMATLAGAQKAAEYGRRAAPFVCTGNMHMGSPDDVVNWKDDPLAGVWLSTKSQIIGAALNGAIARRGGCYAVPTKRGLFDLAGRNAFYEHIAIKEHMPGTDVGWGMEDEAHPMADLVDWLKVYQQRLDWLKRAVDRINRET